MSGTRIEDPGHVEWGTLLPNGFVCVWDTEAKARHAHEMSVRFPDGTHPLVLRAVGSWERVT